VAVEIVVPSVGESVVEVTVSKWLKKEGDRVEAGEPVVEIETDKVDLEVGAEQDGVLAEIKVQEGEDAEVGDVLGLIEESGEGEEEPAQDEDEPEPEPDEPEPDEPEEEEPEEEEPETEEPETEDEEEAERPASPLAREVAREEDADVADVDAKARRVTRDDVETHVEGGNGRGEERVRMGRRRRTIARRLVDAQRTAAALTTFNDVDMQSVLDVRDRHRADFEDRYGAKLGITSFFVKAAIGALRDYPVLNAEVDDDAIVLKHYYDVGIAVATDKGLVVPVLRDADRLSFAEIEVGIRRFAEQARANRLSIEDLRGGTFTITNGGVFGSLLSTPVLNPPQVGILGLHRIEERVVARDGEPVLRPMMYLALTYDHRIVDGREAVRFLVRVKELVEDAEALFLES